MAWPARCREKLEWCVGADHGGGRFDSTLIAIGAAVGLHLGQGGRRAAHLLSALMRGLPHELSTRSIGVAVGAGPHLVDRMQTNGLPRREVDVADVARVVAQERPGLTPFPFQDRIAMLSRDSALLAIDVLSAHTLSVIQFVDDAFVFQTTMWGLPALAGR